MNSRKLNFAIVGAGYWGKNLIRNFATNARSNLKYVCDLDEKLLAIQKKNFPFIETTTDLQEVLSDSEVDAVVIATEVPTHFSIAQLSLEASKHTYVEKPMTSTANQSEILVELAKEKGVKLMVGHLLEYHPGVNFLKEAI
ncbi:MAG: Gfo/Idh/MocA family oxidoreductase, partial [Phycisphaerae bacterium]|nr:Gfo/Idh/MocA family oxidoreductase [Phycisphaerae bacterium]NIT59851.1 Gfo/Idh/MocA family oxidoreductase [Fodinibius sp.]NIU11385.1 Gfo/Idh/MocA family oxidoreductase [Phycisphaerae bacterium]NIU59162.1 Gfo/Idh/MocA family oxidoreductase [Phycisphaerae bacterium]NIV14581.1 Gfo/Idh/MocA family oxidoreductase [Fodinibius sp.]